ncbi:MAG: hypothetical protein QF724_05355 [Planctomycetota bacterium]|nr:hypothetical protein [Planctomycetota bacterium]MDP6368143.1 hypothetical protein [Planctomycetota bacterium]MDP6519996.1 hypothetical protein [Planctomycetota bacterium]MDP6838346.1 hypothetical protein [Planctomycetota bacterium]MDP6954424.1 hypothetical protein [Planctomycetota bacterium]
MEREDSPEDPVAGGEDPQQAGAEPESPPQPDGDLAGSNRAPENADPENRSDGSATPDTRGAARNAVDAREGWGELPPQVRDIFRTGGGGRMPPEYRDWIDSYYRRLNAR